MNVQGEPFTVVVLLSVVGRRYLLAPSSGFTPGIDVVGSFETLASSTRQHGVRVLKIFTLYVNFSPTLDTFLWYTEI